MTSLQLEFLGHIARLGRVEANTPDLREATNTLYDLGYLNIAPPGWCYVINEAGRAALASANRLPQPHRQVA